MEFPNSGIQCTLKNCKQLDFLPFTCSYCSYIFCKEHFNARTHSCLKIVDNIAIGTEKISTYSCSIELCIDKSVVKMPCVKCKKHFCLSHRHHGCLEQSEEEKNNLLEKWEKPKKEFLQAKHVVDEKITNNIKISKNAAMINKLNLMKLKGKSCGPDNVPISERYYFLVHLPIQHFKGSKGAFVSVNWSIGKIIDSLADTLKIPNFNNKANVRRLNIFNFITGKVIATEMDLVLSKLLQNNSLQNGQDIILEYSNDSDVDCTLYK